MRNAVLLGGVLLLGILVFVPSLGSATEADLVATSGIPAKIYGHAEATAAQGTVRIEGDAQGVSFASRAATLESIRVTSSYVRLSLADVAGERRVQTTTAPGLVGAIRIEPIADDFFAAAVGAKASLRTAQSYTQTPAKDFWTAANAQLSGLIADEAISPSLPSEKLAQLSTGEAPRIPLAKGTYALSASGKAAMAETDEVLVYGARLVGSDGRVLGESRRNLEEKPGSVFVPSPSGGTWTGPGSHTEETIDYFRLTGPDAAFAAQGPTTLYASDLRLHVTGYLGMPWAEGTVRTPNETTALSGEQVILGGDLHLRPIGFDASQAPQITLLGNGDIRFIQLGVASKRFGGAEAAAVAGGAAAGVGLLALLVYFWPSLKYGLSLALFPLYARVPKENTLDHKGRELLYDLIKNEPGVSTNKLAKEVPFGWSTLTYHLRVLERNEAIVSVRDGRYKRFFDRQSGRFANGRKYILAVLKNDATYDIARFIKEKPGSSQKEVATSFALSPSSVHWHVERLSEVGLVSKAREAHNVKYFPGEAWDHVTIEDLKALDAAGPEPTLDDGLAPAAEPGGQQAPGRASA